MKYPITRARLQNYVEEARQEEVARRISNALEYVSTAVLNSATSSNKSAVIRTKHIRIQLDEYSTLLELLKERFPDTDIQMDPMKTYILVDWS